MDTPSSRSSISSDLSDLPPDVRTLTQSQSAALADLKCLCEINGVSWPAASTTTKAQRQNSPPAHGNDDITLLRYLRARDYVPEAAFKQYSATCAWRRKLALDDMYTTAEVEHFEAIGRLFPQWTGRRDRRGVPVFVFCVAKIRPEDLLATSKGDPSLSSVFLPAEYSTQFVQPLCARMHPDRAMPCAIQIIDLSGVKVRHFWNLRSHLQKASTMATAHYPESVDKIFILGAPSFFPTIWSFITSWFEPSLTRKIHVLPAADVTPTLTRYIDEDNLPRSMGGSLDWEYGMPPSLDHEARQLVGAGLADDWVPGPLRFVNGEGPHGDSIVELGRDGKAFRGRVLARMEGRRPSEVDSDAE